MGVRGVNVSAIGLGCWGMSGSYGPADEADSAATPHHALDVGVDVFDTADICGDDGRNEALIGLALAGRRHEFVLATKTRWGSDPRRRGRPSGSMGVTGASARPVRRAWLGRGSMCAQAALAWVPSRGEQLIPILGMKRRSRLDENVAAADIAFTSEKLDRLDAAFPPGAAQGTVPPAVARWASAAKPLRSRRTETKARPIW